MRVVRTEHDTIIQRRFPPHHGGEIDLFGCYLAQPRQAQVTMLSGLEVFRDANVQRLRNLLIQPLRSAR